MPTLSQAQGGLWEASQPSHSHVNTLIETPRAARGNREGLDTA